MDQVVEDSMEEDSVGGFVVDSIVDILDNVVGDSMEEEESNKEEYFEGQKENAILATRYVAARKEAKVVST